jgi:hypothetical protein
MHNVGGKEPDGKPTRLGKWTFGTKMVRDVVVDHLSGAVLNACAGKTRLSQYVRDVNIIRNDLNPDIPADSHYDVRTIDEHYQLESFDVVINDPPFDAGRGEKLYEGFHASGYIDARDALSPLVRPGGVYIELGWNSWGLGDKDGWEREEHHLYRQPFKGDVHLVVERRIDQRSVSDY